jgi:hypothetical protein
MKCTYCDNEKTRVVYVYICDSPECEYKAKTRNYSIGNLAKTTFGKTTPPKFTARQERQWKEIAEATGFKE